MRPDETDDRLPPTQRRGRNAWDAIAGVLNTDTLERLAQVIGDLWERIKP